MTRRRLSSSTRLAFVVISYIAATGIAIGMLAEIDWINKPYNVYMWGHWFHIAAGLLIPALMYAIATAFLIHHRSSVKTRRRARRLCGHCAYDLRGHTERSSCPECGRPIGAR